MCLRTQSRQSQYASYVLGESKKTLDLQCCCYVCGRLP